MNTHVLEYDVVVVGGGTAGNPSDRHAGWGVPVAAFPHLAAHAAAVEQLPVFRAIPCDDAVQLN